MLNVVAYASRLTFSFLPGGVYYAKSKHGGGGLFLTATLNNTETGRVRGGGWSESTDIERLLVGWPDGVNPVDKVLQVKRELVVSAGTVAGCWTT